MGRLVVIEGLDGAGKGTLTDGLRGGPGGAGARRRRSAFPRYDADVHAELVRDALLRPARRPRPTRCTRWRCCSRWTAGPRPPSCTGAVRGRTTSCWSTGTSPPTPPTAPPGCTRTPAGSSSPGSGRWRSTGSALPVPDQHLLLDVPRAVAAERAAHRERTERGPPARPLRVRRRAAGPHGGGLPRAGRGAAGWRRGRCSTARRLATDRLRSARRRPARVAGRPGRFTNCRWVVGYCVHEVARTGGRRRPGTGRDADHRAAG